MRAQGEGRVERSSKFASLGGLLLALLSASVAVEARLGPENLGVVANANDPLSVTIAEQYARRRGIPPRNVMTIDVDPRYDAMTVGRFLEVDARLKKIAPDDIQGWVLAFARPFRVECASITAAFALGFSRSLCAEGCVPTARSAYFDSPSRDPYSDLKIRPTMSLAATSLAYANALIERGIKADGSAPKGVVYLLDTSDTARNVRSKTYEAAKSVTHDRLRIEIVKSDALRGRDDVFAYFTGRSWIDDLATNRFVPGAVADHLTSSGGDLFGTKQMSSLRWLEAGATGSYGTVVEPCAFPGKFPNIPVFLKYYLKGETLLEAYWKSVAMPGQGIFIGEPLARPFAAQ